MRPLCTSSKDETFTLNSIKVEWIKFFLTSSVFHRPGARFSKVPIINGPGKLSPFTLKIEVSIVFYLTR